MRVRACAVPRYALLDAYVEQANAYTDCFEIMHPMEVDLSAFITAFYSTWLFRLERFVLTLTLHRWIKDREVTNLAAGKTERFAAWTVEGREETQILLRDLSGATRSYLAVSAKAGGTTRLVFGSAVVSGENGRPVWVNALMPLHRFYSHALLWLAERKLRRG